MTMYISVKVKDARHITERAWLLQTWDGKEDIFPASQIAGWDGDDALWISEWILERKDIQWSPKRKAILASDGRMLPADFIRKHTPVKVTKFGGNEIDELKR